ncbi:50S ribosomal protein L27 [Patescibacteria group bacterium]
MSKTKSTGSSTLGRDSLPKHLGIKIHHGQKAKIGQILIRQRGTKFLPGKNVKRGRDDTLFAMKDGMVHFTRKRKLGFNRAQRIASVVNIK